ncbi:hypothetical protein GCM10027422_38870 [Hymenobacter arcticus]
MKKMMTWGLALASLTFAATSCSDNKATTETTTTPAGTGAMAADSAAPATTISVADTTITAPAPGATAYVCPMHPEVIGDKPGKCPKCYMALVKK